MKNYQHYIDTRGESLFSLNVFIANTKQGVGPRVFPTLVTTLPLQYTYKALHRMANIFEPRHAQSEQSLC